MEETVQKIKIPYRPRNWAKTLLHAAKTRWIALFIHRRGGKTTAAINHLQRDALQNPETRYAYIAPLRVQAKRVVWGMLKFYARDIPGVKFNESELTATYPNGSEIIVLGANNPDSLRGIGLWGAILDEYAQMSPILFTEIVSKCLADHQGYCIFAGTPKGRGHFYRVYQAAQANPDSWSLIYQTIDESLENETGEVIDNLRQSLEDDKQLVEQGALTEDEFLQEWYLSFEAALKGAVYAKEISAARKQKRVRTVPYDPKYPVFTVWDLGIQKKGGAMAIGFYQHIAGTMRMIDYYENTGVGMSHYIKYLKDKPYVYGKHFAPHDINQKELISGKTRLEGAAKLGIEFEVIPRVGLEDGIDLGRALWHTILIDKEKCEVFMDLVGAYQYNFNENLGINSKEPVRNFASHAADVHRYAAVVEDQMYVDKEEDMEDIDDDVYQDDEYMGHEDVEDMGREGYGKHPVLKDTHIGSMGHERKE